MIDRGMARVVLPRQGAMPTPRWAWNNNGASGMARSLVPGIFMRVVGHGGAGTPSPPCWDARGVIARMALPSDCPSSTDEMTYITSVARHSFQSSGHQARTLCFGTFVRPTLLFSLTGNLPTTIMWQCPACRNSFSSTAAPRPARTSLCANSRDHGGFGSIDCHHVTVDMVSYNCLSTKMAWGNDVL